MAFLREEGTEKHASDHNGNVHCPVEGISSQAEDANSELMDTQFTAEQKRRIIRRIDRRLVLTIGAMYCVSLMDRINMGAASIAGMSTDLKLTGFRYNIANLVFFFTYIAFQPPSTILVRLIGPRIHLSTITCLWGVVMIGMGFVQTSQEITGLRTLLGLLEAGFFPSSVYLLSTWYTRYEVGKRYSVFYVIGSVALAFSGILAYGLMQLDGRAGLAGWRWIFVIEGAMTCALAVVSYWLLVDFPDSTRRTWVFLSVQERQWIINRIQRDRGDSETTPFNLREFIGISSDLQVWVYAMIFFNSSAISYALAYNLPIILNSNMGFSVAAAQCLVAPPYGLACIVMLASGWLGDKYHIRGPIIIANMVLVIIGLPLMGWHPLAAVKYVGVFLVTAGASSSIPAVMAFQANNIRGQWKRAFCSATLVGFGGIGGIAGSSVFREQDKSNGYKPGMIACMSCAVLSIILVVLCDWELFRRNRKADLGEEVLESAKHEAMVDSFRYTY